MLRSIAVGAVLALGATAAVQAQHAPKQGAERASAHGTPAAHGHATVPTAACAPDKVGPQSPRDITGKAGDNGNATFAVARQWSEMSVCNIHLHKNAEHKGIAFNVGAAPSGFRCNATKELSAAQQATVPELPHGACGGSVKPGDTIEVHWVFTSCTDTTPGPTLGACSTEKCSKPSLRVESQVFLVVNGGATASLGAIAQEGFGSATKRPDGRWQPTAAPPAAAAVQYRGSTTNTAYDNVNSCSPVNVTWNVRSSCLTLDIRALNTWCEGRSSNPFREKQGAALKAIEGHGARKLVTLPKLLSKID